MFASVNTLRNMHLACSPPRNTEAKPDHDNDSKIYAKNEYNEGSQSPQARDQEEMNQATKPRRQPATTFEANTKNFTVADSSVKKRPPIREILQLGTHSTGESRTPIDRDRVLGRLKVIEDMRSIYTRQINHILQDDFETYEDST